MGMANDTATFAPTSVIRLADGNYLGRYTINEPLHGVPLAFAACMPQADAETLATKHNGTAVPLSTVTRKSR